MSNNVETLDFEDTRALKKSIREVLNAMMDSEKFYEGFDELADDDPKKVIGKEIGKHVEELNHRRELVKEKKENGLAGTDFSKDLHADDEEFIDMIVRRLQEKA